MTKMPKNNPIIPPKLLDKVKNKFKLKNLMVKLPRNPYTIGMLQQAP